MKIGELRHRVGVLEFVTYYDEWENQRKEWIEVEQVWAKVSNLHGREYFAAATIQLEKTLVFTVRYKEGLDESMRLRFQGKSYDIQFVDNIKYRNKFMEIKALLTSD